MEVTSAFVFPVEGSRAQFEVNVTITVGAASPTEAICAVLNTVSDAVMEGT